MNLRTLLLLVLIVDFAVLSGYALLEHGYLGLFQYQLLASAGWQVLADLVIACTLIMLWMVDDARRSGRTVWPYLVATATLGSFGPLFYLLVGQLQGRSREHALA
ncbi:MAG TPA: DUF2834 domain-containing protein [Solimonas sp.]|nr:DUF2834 domain-containing protein [Solimonas sp.]